MEVADWFVVLLSDAFPFKEEGVEGVLVVAGDEFFHDSFNVLLPRVVGEIGSGIDQQTEAGETGLVIRHAVLDEREPLVLLMFLRNVWE